MTMDLTTAIDVIDVILDELVTLRVLPLYRYDNMSKEDREKLIKLLVTRYGERKPGWLDGEGAEWVVPQAKQEAK